MLSTKVPKRENFLTSRDILRIEVSFSFKGSLIRLIIQMVYSDSIEAEKIRLHRNDGESVLQWVARLRDTGDILAFKSSSSDPPPPGFKVASDTFVLIIQTRYQKET